MFAIRPGATLLTKKAAAEGVEVEQYAVEALRRVAELPTISELFADVGPTLWQAVKQTKN